MSDFVTLRNKAKEKAKAEMGADPNAKKGPAQLMRLALEVVRKEPVVRKKWEDDPALAGVRADILYQTKMADKVEQWQEEAYLRPAFKKHWEELTDCPYTPSMNSAVANYGAGLYSAMTAAVFSGMFMDSIGTMFNQVMENAPPGSDHVVAMDEMLARLHTIGEFGWANALYSSLEGVRNSLDVPDGAAAAELTQAAVQEANTVWRQNVLGVPPPEPLVEDDDEDDGDVE